jgi:hypothetical protein
MGTYTHMPIDCFLYVQQLAGHRWVVRPDIPFFKETFKEKKIEFKVLSLGIFRKKNTRK